MKCFNHQAADAIAVCRSCGRAICHDCVVEVETVCACKNRCERQVAILNAMLGRTKAAQGALPLLSLFLFLLGGVFLWWGSSSRDMFMLILGGVFLVCGVALFVIQRRRK